MRWSLAAVTLAALVLAWAPPALAQADASLTIEAHDGPGLCPEEKSYCFQVIRGSLDALDPGDTVEITLGNRGSAEHTLVLAPLSAADPQRQNTSRTDAFGAIEDVKPGEQVTATFQIPDGIDGLYLWCDITGHERLGMWTAHAFSGGELGGATTDGNVAPGPGAALLVVLAACALTWRRL